jgi:antitoxin (DNA-binding transcriptional repressor) of toxin-antitoxin stability system
VSQTLVNVNDLPARLDELVRLANEGAEIIVADHNGPRARLVPVQPAPGARAPGLHAAKIQVAADFDEPLPEELWAGAP